MDGKNAFEDQNLSQENIVQGLRSLKVMGLSTEP